MTVVAVQTQTYPNPIWIQATVASTSSKLSGQTARQPPKAYTSSRPQPYGPSSSLTSTTTDNLQTCKNLVSPINVKVLTYTWMCNAVLSSVNDHVSVNISHTIQLTSFCYYSLPSYDVRFAICLATVTYDVKCSLCRPMVHQVTRHCSNCQHLNDYSSSNNDGLNVTAIGNTCYDHCQCACAVDVI